MKSKKWAACLGISFMLMTAMAGCGRDGAETAGNTVNEDNTVNTGETADESNGMGRYVEDVIDLSDQIIDGRKLFQLDDGSLMIVDTDSELYRSEDGGTTWESGERSWRTTMKATSTHITDLAMGADQTVGVICDTKKTASSSGDSQEVVMILPDETQISAEISLSEEDMGIYGVWVSDAGRVFVTTYGPSIYEVKEDGTSEKFLVLDSAYAMPDLIQFQDSLMIMDGESYDGLLIYDMEKKEYIEDEILNDFINANYRDRTLNWAENNGKYYDLYFFPGEDNVLYLAGKKGLHRHVIGGSVMEQIIDGSHSILSNPAYRMCGMTVYGDSEFVGLFYGGKLVHFTYDSDIPTVPGEELRVYSLRDNRTLRQAINLYQKANPECYVEYEIGMEEGSSMTRDDALKNLNTAMMAGEGPDVLVMDNLPADAYLEKGMLLELTPFIESLEEEDALFENIVDAFRTEGQVYMIPCEIQLPIILGEETYVSKAADLSGVADAMETLRQDQPEQDLIGVFSEEAIMRLFSIVSAPDWKTDGGEVNREALADYYEQVRRIYVAQRDGLSENMIKEYTEYNDYILEQDGFDPEDVTSFVKAGINYLTFVTGERQLSCGTLQDFDTYAVMLSLQQAEEYKETEVTLMTEGVFLPQAVVGINAASDHTERAEGFLRLIFGKENQSMLFGGLPVNQSVFDEYAHGKEHEEDIKKYDNFGAAGFVTRDGKEISMRLYWPREDQIKTLRSWVETADTPYIEDELLENAVYKEGISYLQGRQSVEEAVEAVEKTVLLYMAE